jgi:hypothetical protein
MSLSFCPERWVDPRTPELIALDQAKAFARVEVQADAVCPICYESFKKDEFMMILHCQHKYHCDCLCEWLLKRNK